MRLRANIQIRINLENFKQYSNSINYNWVSIKSITRKRPTSEIIGEKICKRIGKHTKYKRKKKNINDWIAFCKKDP